MKTADRMRVKGVGAEYSELLRMAGVKTVNELNFVTRRIFSRECTTPISANWCSCCRRRDGRALDRDAKKLPTLIRY